jgi:O-glycosyl hydrolase
MYKPFGRDLLYAASEIEHVSLTAARRTDGALTIMAINLGDEPVTAPLALQGFTPSGDAEVYRFDADHNAEQVENVAVADGSSLTLPPRSMTLYVLK